VKSVIRNFLNLKFSDNNRYRKYSYIIDSGFYYFPFYIFGVIEFSPKTTAAGNNVYISIQDLEKTNFQNNMFDYITSLSVIEHGVNHLAYYDLGKN
jgi:hypothetical protein